MANAYAIVLIYLFVLGSQGFGAIARLYTFPCLLAEEPTPQNIYQLWPNICVVNRAGLHTLNLPTPEGRENQLRHYGSLYLGINLLAYLSIHYKFLGYQSNQPARASRLSWPYRSIENWYLQLGNTYLSKNYLALGRINMPIGLNHRPFAPIFRIMKEDDWDEAELGIKYTRKNNNDTKYEFAARFSDSDEWQGESHSIIEEYYIRANINLAALEGTKIIASASNQENVKRRYGLAMLNQSQRAKTSLEWLRTYNYQVPNIPYRQLFRLNHLTPITMFKQVIFQYEQNQYRYWQALLRLQRYYSEQRFHVNFTIGYRKSLIISTDTGWIVGSGMDIKI